MFQDTLPAPFDATAQCEPWAEFRVDNPREIAALLRQVRDASANVIVASPSGHSVHCTLWAMDTEQRRLNFSADSDSPQLASVIDANEATCVVYLDHIKLQFELHDLLLVRGTKSSALQAALPQEIYRFQRRNSFRVRPAGRGGPSVTLRHPAMPDMKLKLRLLDISVGGCALLLPRNVPELRPGVVVRGAMVQLELDTGFEVALHMRHVASLQAHEHGVRVGCEWHEPSAAAVRALQRYVDQTQKRRRLMLP